MNKVSYKKVFTALFVLVVILAIILIERTRVSTDRAPIDVVELGQVVSSGDSTYEPAKEIVGPTGFINTPNDLPIMLADYIGQRVILVDFWTYSCINCQRTLPYLNAWHEAYEDDGLLIVGIHRPEFEFEKKFENVVSAVEKWGIEYPVVLDNNAATWRAYENRYWPRKYLIDINGNIVYDHIGEGGYEETEQLIQELLQERATELGVEGEMAMGDLQSSSIVPTQSTTRGKTPELYLGSSREMNRHAGMEGLPLHHYEFSGEFLPSAEFTRTSGELSLHFFAQDVYVVTETGEPVAADLYLDGEFLRTHTFEGSDLSTLIELEQAEGHILKIDFHGEVDVYTFTFG